MATDPPVSGSLADSRSNLWTDAVGNPPPSGRDAAGVEQTRDLAAAMGERPPDLLEIRIAQELAGQHDAHRQHAMLEQRAAEDRLLVHRPDIPDGPEI